MGRLQQSRPRSGPMLGEYNNLSSKAPESPDENGAFTIEGDLNDELGEPVEFIGMTAAEAVESDRFDKLQQIAKLNPFLLSIADQEGRTPALVTIENGHASTLILLYHYYRGDLISTTDKEDQTSAMIAVKNILNASDNKGRTPAIVATTNGHTEILGFLRRYGGDLSASDKEGRTLKEIADANGHTEISKLLERIENGTFKGAIPFFQGMSDGQSQLERDYSTPSNG